jgi:hypothetical protein
MPTPAIDHVVLVVRELEAAAFTGLGFTLTPSDSESVTPVTSPKGKRSAPGQLFVICKRRRRTDSRKYSYLLAPTMVRLLLPRYLFTLAVVRLLPPRWLSSNGSNRGEPVLGLGRSDW